MPRILAVQCFGALAQLGERDAGSVEVTGSIPVGSTNFHFLTIRTTPSKTLV